MRHFILIGAFILSYSLQAQESDSALVKDYLFYRDNISLKGMSVLRYWGASNLVVGGIGAFTTEGNVQYFSQMNMVWGGVDLLMGILGSATYRTKVNRYEVDYLKLEQKKIERNFLINVGLDAVYIGAGAYMLNYSNREGVQKERVEGYAFSVMLQGAFLLVMDATLYHLHKRNRKKRLDKLEKVKYW